MLVRRKILKEVIFQIVASNNTTDTGQWGGNAGIDQAKLAVIRNHNNIGGAVDKAVKGHTIADEVVCNTVLGADAAGTNDGLGWTEFLLQHTESLSQQ